MGMFKRKGENVFHNCAIRLLDDLTVLEYEVLENHKGIYLIDELCHRLEIKEKEYFGLRYVDAGNQRQWLDLGKLIIKQCKDVCPLILSFRVKFYPVDPFHLSTNVRILLYKQLKRDLFHGRLYCSNDENVTLGSLIVQEQLGDFDPNVHKGDYVSNLQLAIRQIEAIEKRIVNKHMSRNPGQNLTITIDEFLGTARSLETYGIEPHYVKNQQGCQMYIGINFSGISAFISGKRSQHLRWSEIRKINYESRMFIVHTAFTDANRDIKKQAYGFKCISGAACRYFWRSAIEHMFFFTLPNCHNACVKYGGGIFSRGAKFKYTGRTEKEIFTDLICSSNFKLGISSSEDGAKSNSVPVTPSSPKGNLSYIRYNTLPRSGISDLLDCLSAGNEYNFDENQFTGQNAKFSKTKHEYVQESYSSYDDESYTINYHSRDSHSYVSDNSVGKAHGIPENILTCIAGKERNTKKLIRLFWKFSILRSFLPCLAFVVFTMILSVFFIFESNLELFDSLKKAPEMVFLKGEYYAPFKKFIQDTILI